MRASFNMRDDRFFLGTVDAREGRFRIVSALAVMFFLVDDWKLDGDTAGVIIIISLWSCGSKREGVVNSTAVASLSS